MAGQLLSLFAVEDVDSLYEFHERNGVEIREPIANRPYDMRDYQIRDLVHFTTPKYRARNLLVFQALCREHSDRLNKAMEPLMGMFEGTGIMRSVQIPDKPIGVNRHDVLHGDSNDYGQKVNSYKVLSLLNYVANTIADIKQFPKR